MQKNLRSFFQSIGPGLLVAAAGVGAGDMIVGLRAGSEYGMTLAWVVVFTGLIKYALTEGLARWQLASGETILESWVRRFHWSLGLLFIGFLTLWSFMVGGALISANGLAAHALLPQLSIPQWGIVHSLLAFGLVYWGRYSWIENLTKVLISLMFLVVIISAAFVQPDWDNLAAIFWPSLPTGASPLALAIVGGVGGSLTMLSYSYWLQEKGWEKAEQIKAVRLDLKVAYGLTCLFVLALMWIAASMELAQQDLVGGKQLVLLFAEQMRPIFGDFGVFLFQFGFWGTVFSSLVCVWNGIPYLFADFIYSTQAHRQGKDKTEVSVKSPYYRWYLAFLSFPPILLLFWNDAVKNVINYALISSVFAVFLAAMLLYMGNRKNWMQGLSNRWGDNLLLVLALVLFLALLWSKL